MSYSFSISHNNNKYFTILFFMFLIILAFTVHYIHVHTHAPTHTHTPTHTKFSTRKSLILYFLGDFPWQFRLAGFIFSLVVQTLVPNPHVKLGSLYQRAWPPCQKWWNAKSDNLLCPGVVASKEGKGTQGLPVEHGENSDLYVQLSLRNSVSFG